MLADKIKLELAAIDPTNADTCLADQRRVHAALREAVKDCQGIAEPDDLYDDLRHGEYGMASSILHTIARELGVEVHDG